MATVFVGNLDIDARERDLEQDFSRYGKITKIWIARNPPGFAFIDYEDDRDARDAVRDMHDRVILSKRIRVEISTRNSKGGDRGSRRDERRDDRDFGRDRERDRDRRDRSRDRDERERRGSRGRGDRDQFNRDVRAGSDLKSPGLRTEFRVRVTNLPDRVGWRSLKNFLSDVHIPSFVEVAGRNEGIAEFASEDHVDDVIRKLDQSKFDGSVVTIERDGGSRNNGHRSDDN